MLHLNTISKSCCKNFTKIALLCGIQCIMLTQSFAKNITVTSITALQSAINSSAAGDSIFLANGVYTNNTFSIGASNIVVQPVTLGGVFLNGTNAITITGNNNKFLGFQFTFGTINGTAINVSGNFNTLSHLNFNGYDAGHMVLISGQNNLLTNSNFQNKPAVNNINHGGTGDMVQIIPNVSIIGYNTIRYCSFQQMPGFGGDFGNECIRIGDQVYSTYISRTVVEYCYFEDTGRGDSEAISIKSRENCLRFNTMFNNPDAMFAFRNGDNNVAYGNFFIRSGGFRFKQANNIFCYNNYFERCGIGQNNSLPGGGTYPIRFEYFAPGYGNNFNLINNTFYRCGKILIDTSITNATWANNAIYSDSSSILSGTTAGQKFIGNIYKGNLGLTISSGMTNSDPLMALNTNGFFSLTGTSPCIAAGSTGYPSIIDIPVVNNDPNVLLDIEGQARPSALNLKDVGCDQYATTPTNNKPLKLADVGPTYLKLPSIVGDSVVCETATLQFTDAIKSGTWTSSNPLVASIDNSGNLVGVAGGTVVVGYSVNQSGNISNVFKIVKVLSAPVKPVIAWNGTQLSNSSTGVNYQWIFNNAPIVGATISTYKPLVNGSFKIQITDANGCKNTSDSLKLVITAISNPASTPASHIAKIWPNPAQSSVEVSFGEMPLNTLNIYLINMEGKIIKTLNTRNQQTNISLNTAPAGQYFLKIIGKEYNQTQEFTVIN